MGCYFYFPRASKGPIDSVAVLPFANTNGDPNTEYLSDGIAETLINSLSQIQQLRVVARSTAFRYKGKEIDPQALGRDLNARAVLTGRVRQFGDTLNIQVDLVDAITGAQLWGEEYDRKVSDVLAVKQDIALNPNYPTVHQWYSIYLRAQGRREESMKEIKRAQELDPLSPVIQVNVVGEFIVRGDLDAATTACNKVIELDPNHPLAHGYLGWIYQKQGRYEQALPELQKWVDLSGRQSEPLGSLAQC